MKLVSPDGNHEVDTESPNNEPGQVLTWRAMGYATKEQHAADAKAQAAAEKVARESDAPVQAATPKTEARA